MYDEEERDIDSFDGAIYLNFSVALKFLPINGDTEGLPIMIYGKPDRCLHGAYVIQLARSGLFSSAYSDWMQIDYSLVPRDAAQW